ncbi:hypothetical protein PY247_11660 [Acinetobacter proteolyticus]|nr:hypothetical protein [Acinetobacter proteolyticus]WEI17202.1 hypothetical protein PY247_11660 [Acinetobacter proteolyticus]
MLEIQEYKISEFAAERDKEFLFDLIYEIIIENKDLKLNSCFNGLINPVKKIVDYYLDQGIDQIETLKYMVKSHVYLGQDYIEDEVFSWLRNYMQNFDKKDQLNYVNHFSELVDNYKIQVLGLNFEKLILALEECRILDGKRDFKDIYPEKYDFLNARGIIKSRDVSSCGERDALEFVLGFNYENNIFFSQILKM